MSNKGNWLCGTEQIDVAEPREYAKRSFGLHCLTALGLGGNCLRARSCSLYVLMANYL